MRGSDRFTCRFSAVILLMHLTLGAGGTALASTYYWDPNGTNSSPIWGASPNAGTWGASMFWTTDATGAFADGGFVIPADAAVSDFSFGKASAYLPNGNPTTIAISGAVDARGIATFTTSGGISFSGGTINLGSGGITVNNYNGNNTTSGGSTVLNLTAGSGVATRIANNDHCDYYQGGMQWSGGITGTGDLEIASNTMTPNAGIYFNSAAVNHVGTITNTGTGAMLDNIRASVLIASLGSNVTAVTQSSSSSMLFIDGFAAGFRGALTINAGILRVANTLYGSAVSNITPDRVTVSPGGTFALKAGGAGYSAADVGNVLAQLGAGGAGGFQGGSSIGVDVSGGSVTYGGNLGNTGNGALGLTVMGTPIGNTLTLSGSNTFAGPTRIVSATLQVNSAAALGGGGAITFGAPAFNFTGYTNSRGDRNGSSVSGILQFGPGANNCTFANNIVSSSRAMQFDTAGQNVTLSGAIDGSNTGDGFGPIAASFIKTGAGTLTLSGTNAYPGATTVSAGMLKVGGAITASSAMTVSGGTIGGTGAIAPAVTLSGTAGINLQDGAIGTLTLGGNLGITGAAGANLLRFDLGAGAGGTDKIAVGGNTSVTTAGAAVIMLNQIGGIATPIDAGTYDLIAGSGTMAAAKQFALATTGAFGRTFRLQLDGTSKTLQLVVAAGDPGPAAAFWKGGATNWSDVANWNTDEDSDIGAAAVPGNQANVFLHTTTPPAGNLTNGFVNADFDINSLNYIAAVTSNTAIGGTKILTIEAAAVNGNAAGNGITVETPVSGSPTNSIATSIGLASSQTWTVNTGAALTVSGVITDFLQGNSLTKAGAGKLTLTGANTFSGAVTLTDGTLSVAADSHPGAANPLIFNGGILQVTGTTMTTFGTHVPAFSADKTVGMDISNSGNSFTVSQAMNQAGGGLTKLGSGTLVLSATNTYTGVTAITAGTLRIDNSNALASTSGILLSSGARLEVNAGSANISKLNTANGGSGVVAGSFLKVDNVNPAGLAVADMIFGTIESYIGNAGNWTGSLSFGQGSTYVLSGSGGVTSPDMKLYGDATLVHYNSSAGANLGVVTSGDAGTHTLYLGQGDGALARINTGIQDGAGKLNVTLLPGARWSPTLQNLAASPGAVTYSGVLTIGPGARLVSGNVAFTQGWEKGGIQNAGSPSVLGLSSAAASNLVFNGGTLSNIHGSSGQDRCKTDKLFTIIGGTSATLTNEDDSRGDNSLSLWFTGTGSIVITDTNTSQTLYLSSFNSTTGQFWPVLPDNGTGKTSLQKSGPGTWVLYGANTYSGDTLVSAGTLRLGNNLAIQNSALNVTGTGALTLAAGITTPALGGLKGGNSLTLTNTVTSLTLNTGAGITNTFSGALGGGTNMALIKTGAGTQVFSGTNTYTGDTTVSGGTLSLGTAGLCDTSSVYVASGAALDLTFSGSDTIDSLYLNGNRMPIGIYGAATHPAFFTGSGTLTATNGPTGDNSAALSNSTATGITTAAALLNATLSCSGAPCQVSVYWSTSDGGTNAALWAHSAPVGSWANVSATNISCLATGLLPSTIYLFAFRATNELYDVWATNILSFATLALPPAPAFDGSAITFAGGAPSLHFSTVAGFKYGLDYKDALTNTSWLPVISSPDFPPPDGWSAVSTGATMSITDTNAASQLQRFYRLKAAYP